MLKQVRQEMLNIKVNKKEIKDVIVKIMRLGDK